MRTKTAHHRPCSGFTLLEVLVVVAIIGILVTIGTAGMQYKIAQDAVKGQAFIIKGFLEQVGAQARAKGENRSVSFSGRMAQAYSGIDCVVANALSANKEELEFRTEPDNTTGTLPAAIPSSPWTCLNFTPRARTGLNPLNTPGYIKIQSATYPSLRALVGKPANDNNYSIFYSTDGGASWTQL